MKIVCILGDFVLTISKTLLRVALACYTPSAHRCLPSLSLPVIKTRLQSLQRGVNEDTYSGILDCTK